MRVPPPLKTPAPVLHLDRLACHVPALLSLEPARLRGGGAVREGKRRAQEPLRRAARGLATKSERTILCAITDIGVATVSRLYVKIRAINLTLRILRTVNDSYRYV
jgi:hypothetical protein